MSQFRSKNRIEYLETVFDEQFCGKLLAVHECCSRMLVEKRERNRSLYKMIETRGNSEGENFDERNWWPNPYREIWTTFFPFRSLRGKQTRENEYTHTHTHTHKTYIYAYISFYIYVRRCLKSRFIPLDWIENAARTD